jgi:serine/threonine protein phosphatase PrpC
MANRALRSALEAVPGMIEVYHWLEESPITPLSDLVQHSSQPLAAELSQVFNSLFPAGRWQQLDTRYLRLLLPACVITVVRLELSGRTFDFAHVGDTALLKADNLGHVHLLTQDQMGRFDDEALEEAWQAVQQPGNQVDNVAQAVERVRSVRETNLLNRIRHNYVNEQGHTQSGEGCGVINGLTALEAYIQTGQGVLNSGDRLYLLSDGLTLPLSLPRETPSPHIQDDVAGWTKALIQGDVQALLRHIQSLTEADISRNVFPRFKHRDDATAVLITVL